ncbi:MAG: Gfo/Idh/MocA family oxidoreductase [Acidobacteriaceae bacterium]
MRARVVEDGKVRYAVVGAGWISQAEFMPGVSHTGNSELRALVTGSDQKAAKLGERYGITHTFSYEEYDEMLRSDVVDAVYLALPNFAHVDFAVRALDAGIHLLLEKPMAVSVAQCERICAAAERSGAKLMIAYRLHNEPGTLDALRAVREHEFGSALLFNSTFSQQIAASNHRAKHGFWAGPVPDMGPYPINTVRTLFGAEPTEVFATGVCTDPDRFNFEDTVAVTLKFPGSRLAAFTLSYNGGDVDDFRVVGTKGDMFSQPAYQVGLAPEHITTVEKKKHAQKFHRTDQFGGELKYFSQCILDDRTPEPDGEEGLLDVRVIEAIERSLRTGQRQELDPYYRSRRATADQVEELRPVAEPELIGAKKPSAA